MTKSKSKKRTKPKLNKKQRTWVEKFQEQHPGAKVKDIWQGLSGDRIVTIEWTEDLPVVQLPNSTDRGSGWIFHTLRVKLRVFGDPRCKPDYKYHIIYPHCTLDVNVKLAPCGQLSLEISQLLNIEIPQEPVKIKSKRRLSTPTKRQKPTQLKLPLFNVAAQLHQINTSKGFEVTSEQELLLETVVHHDLDTGNQIQLPAAVVSILKNKKASLQEWENAISLYQVAGSTALMTYLEGLDSIRQHFGIDKQLDVQKSAPKAYQINKVYGI
ncbi:hypothetical protein DSM106972_097920 [Dulcicalothrix desertica PCC 7102]|uniref:Uncharacterized protein n=1 Tax=Dulcicalothrix desertica PCC 7102 TaxID=232991 RepID=A0A3S1BWK1_9CYAN|nr:hypothetical protein [Dulcicalothrix desertica]RUS92897.1 hypothetical protein DSM106972_097920 [Dulcicalothrix desertica PCC 7102]TWH61443.1 hypothetical protein CAL7102_01010 [Dulcicalothrix desertica PCC 7102]